MSKTKLYCYWVCHKNTHKHSTHKKKILSLRDTQQTGEKKYTVFQKNGHPFYFFHNSLKWWSIYTKFLPDVAEEMLIQNIWTKYGC